MNLVAFIRVPVLSPDCPLTEKPALDRSKTGFAESEGFEPPDL